MDQLLVVRFVLLTSRKPADNVRRRRGRFKMQVKSAPVRPPCKDCYEAVSRKLQHKLCHIRASDIRSWHCVRLRHPTRAAGR